MEKMTDNEILDAVIEEFKLLAKIPRPSFHEKQASDFLKNYFADMGFEVIQDEVNNIIVNINGSDGKENAPLVVLQSHMDMVAVSVPDMPFDPLKDPIRLRRDDKYLTAMGTSLGADDGIGIAIMMFLAKNLKEHGRLRFIFTVDEEVGMKGASHLDAKYLTDAKYLINCDSENFDEIIVGCAGNVTIEFKKQIERVAVTKKNIVKIELTGLLGGHSGERIGDNRANAIISLARAIRSLENYGEFEIISIDGGSARNAIPSLASAVIATDIDTDMLKIALMEAGRNIYSMYDEEGAEFTVNPIDTDRLAIKKEDGLDILRFINLLHSGVYAMSKTSNMVETSANLGVIRSTKDSVDISFLPRSSRDKNLDIFISQAKDLADLTGFSMIHSEKIPAWSQKTSFLAEKMSEIFKKITGKEMKINEMHAGIECGYHYRKNANLDIVSIGVTNEEIHSPRERVVLATVAPIVRLVAATLMEI